MKRKVPQPFLPSPQVRPPLDQMTQEEIRTWLFQTREALQRKMQRERAYLHRRASRGIRTPTDEVYKQDQLLEADLLALLQEIIKLSIPNGDTGI